MSKRCKRHVDVIWLDLAEACGSVPRNYLLSAQEQFWVPPDARNRLKCYERQFRMRFTIESYTVI